MYDADTLCIPVLQVQIAPLSTYTSMAASARNNTTLLESPKDFNAIPVPELAGNSHNKDTVIDA